MSNEQIKDVMKVISVLAIIFLAAISYYFFLFEPTSDNSYDFKEEDIIGSWYRMTPDDGFNHYNFYENGTMTKTRFEKYTEDGNESYNVNRDEGSWSFSDDDIIEIDCGDMDFEGKCMIPEDYKYGHPEETFTINSIEFNEYYVFKKSENGFKQTLKNLTSGVWKKDGYRIGLDYQETYESAEMYDTIGPSGEWRIEEGNIVFSFDDEEVRADLFLTTNGRVEYNEYQMLLVLDFPEKGKITFREY